jgi:hypothetical protein
MSIRSRISIIQMHLRPSFYRHATTYGQRDDPCRRDVVEKKVLAWRGSVARIRAERKLETSSTAMRGIIKALLSLSQRRSRALRVQGIVAIEKALFRFA